MGEKAIPPGLCQCGCGQETRRAPYTSARVGWVRGEWTRYVLGHNFKAEPRYEIDPGTGCWNTLGAKTPTGYGKICVARKTILLHRYMYERLFGPIPDGMQLHHICRNQSCCNPAHLRTVTRKEHRAIDKAKLTDADVREILLLASSGTIRKTEIAHRFGISVGYVHALLAGKRHVD